jgi:putative ABC transport system permease protein
MIQMILRKMLNNLWMVICLLLGSILAVALISSIPVYTDGILQRLLTKDLEEFQVKRSSYPGRSHLRRSFYMPDEPEKKLPFYRFLDEQIQTQLVPSLDIPVAASTKQLTLDYLNILPEEVAPDKGVDVKVKFVKIEGMRDFNDHISLVAGRAAVPGEQEGVIEAVISEKAMKDLDLYIDRTYDIWDTFFTKSRIVKIRVVGVYTLKDVRDPFWYRSLYDYNESLMIDLDTLEERFVENMTQNFTYASWYYALDYHTITLRQLPGLVARTKEYQRLAKEYLVEWDFPMLGILEDYNKRANVLKLTLWFLQVPVLLMLVFFIYMVSQLIIENDANEIAVLKSRGSSSRQVFLLYLIESVILAGVAMVVGPPLGLFICRILGSSNGFLEFVQRTALPLSLSGRAYVYALLGAALFVTAMLLPAFVASRTTIVEHKKKRGRARSAPFWKRFFIDAILVGVSLYGLYSYYSQQKVLKITGVEGSSLPLDPLLFVISVAFILGVGMLFLRVYPVLIRGLFWLGRKVWTPVFYASFVHVGRALGHEQFLMIFLILSLGLGSYNSVTARTINRNVEEKIRYTVGADVTLQPHWIDAAPKPSDGPAGPEGLAMGGSGGSSGGGTAPQWVEPLFLPYESIAGTERVTKVYVNSAVSATLGSGRRTVGFMGVIPNEFAKVGWFRSDLLPVHWNNYLNLLSRSPKAALVSTNLKDEFDLRLGDVVYLTWAGQSSIDCYIYGFIDYWPTYNPQITVAGKPAAFVVTNLAYVQAKMVLEPYQVWLRKAPGAKARDVFDDIKAKKLEIDSLTDASQEIIIRRNDPTLQGTNGTLTLGFIITMGISIVGFIIYWVLSLKGRTLQFGIFRAMGLTQSQVIWMLILEQILISGAAIVVGIVIGNVASALFVPLLQLTSSAAGQVPPFRIVALRSDFLKIVGVAVAMLVAGAVLFRWMVGRIRIHQAIKLGEE